MRKLILLLLMLAPLYSQQVSFPSHSMWPMWNYWNSTTDSTLILIEITNVTDTGTDSVAVIGSNSNQSFTDSTYWLINRTDAIVTWSNADQILKYNGWQSTATLYTAGATTYYTGLACLKNNGDTTTIAYKRYEIIVVTGFPYTFPITLE